MKRFLIHFIFVIMIFIAYFLQSNFFSWFKIAGVMPNLFIILIVWIGLFGNKFMGVTYGLVLGFILDYLFKTKVGITAIGLAGIAIIAKLFDKNFSKNSRITIMMMIASLTAIFEIFSYIANSIFCGTQIELLTFINILVIEVIYNVMLTIIIYPLIQKYGYYVENEYQGNKILTRYF